MTLRTRITLLTLFVLTLSLLVIGSSVYALLQRYLYQNLRTELAEATEQVVRLINQGSQQGINLFEIALPPSLYAEIDLVVTSPPYDTRDLVDGVIPIRNPTLGGYRLQLKPEDYQTLLREQSLWTISTLPRENAPPLKLMVHAVLVEAQYPGLDRIPAVILTAKPVEGIEATLRELARSYAFTAVTVLLLGSLLAYLLVTRTLQPLETVARKAEEVSLQGVPSLPEPRGKDEVAALVRALNRMLSRLEAAFRSQTRFLADASHELRTPVTAILGHVGYLLRRTSLTEAQRESLEIIRREAERMTKLVTDLLDLAGSEGGWRLEVRPVNLATLLTELADEYRPAFNGRIVVEAPSTVWVAGDDSRLHQVFANLVNNAIKAGARTITLRARSLGEKVVVQVADDGPGIPPEHLPYLFERFYRVDKARDRAAGGSGLGLAIVKAIVEAHGGEVWVESELGKGAVFSVSLRRAVAQPLPQH